MPPPAPHWSKPAAAAQRLAAPAPAASARPAVPPPPVHWGRKPAQPRLAAPGTAPPRTTPAPPPVHWPARSAAVQRMEAPPSARKKTEEAPTQHEVLRHRKGPKQGRWYSTYNTGKTFKTKEEALLYHRRFVAAELAAREAEQEAAHERRVAAHRERLAAEFGDYVPPESNEARVYKSGDSESDILPLTRLAPENAKRFMENAIARRRAEEFKAEGIELLERHFVLDPGTDIGITPALLRPDLGDEEGRVPLSRDGRPKKYRRLASKLDDLVTDRVGRVIRRLKAIRIRQRLGRDIDRATRNSPLSGDLRYTEEEKNAIAELAAILRLDKGRESEATRYIRGTFTAGDKTYEQLLVEKHYVGAGKGGVEALRRIAEVGGDVSEGSDIEDRPAEGTRKRKRTRTRKAAKPEKPVVDETEEPEEPEEGEGKGGPSTPPPRRGGWRGRR